MPFLNCMVGHLSDVQLETVARGMDEVMYSRGDVIMRQDDRGDAFYILEVGEVSVTVRSFDIACLTFLIVFVCVCQLCVAEGFRHYSKSS